MRLSVLLPVFNVSEYILQSITSILSQSFYDFELVIINDGSTDDTESLIKKVDDPRIRYFKKEHTGLADSLNFGLQKCSSQIVARMDADDICALNWLEREFNVFNKKKRECVLSSWRAVFKDNRIKYIIDDKLEPTLINKKLLLHSFISHPGVMYNKDLIISNGGYRGDVYEDYDLWLRIHDKVEFYILPEVLIFQRIREDSLSRNNYNENRKKHYAIQEPFYKSSLKNFNIENKDEENEYRGWREYFYGNIHLARKYWIKLSVKIFMKPRIIIAFLLTFFPEYLSIKIKTQLIRYRLKYSFNYYSNLAKTTRKNFNHLINH